MNIGIIGAGLIGQKRAKALNKDDNLEFVCDINKGKAQDLASKHGAYFSDKFEEIVNFPNIDVVFISVVNKFIMPVALFMLRNGKHILCEKPLGRNKNESKQILLTAEQHGKLVKTGFNHRFHPAIFKAKKIIETNGIGKLLNLRAVYGHGGRPGMENEWRCSEDLCGGGELLDQGVHLIDLINWLSESDIEEVYGQTHTAFWPIEVEDNVFFIIKTKDNVSAICHVSWTMWKNKFELDIYGEKGFISINGLGGSYGVETITYGIRDIKGGKPRINKLKYEIGDNSWELEWNDFKKSIKNKTKPLGSGLDGLKANQIIEAIYKSSEINKPVCINFEE